MATRPVLLLSLGLGIAIALAWAFPAKSARTLPLADLKLVAEQSVPPTELMFASRNGNRWGHRGGARPYYDRKHVRDVGELVRLESR